MIANSDREGSLDNSCKGKVALVTGAAGNGLGRSIALTLAREGAKVIINYRSSEKTALQISTYITESGGTAIAVQADVFNKAGCTTLVDQAKKAFGNIDIAIIGPGGGWNPQAIDQMDPDEALENITQETAPLLYLLPLLLPDMYKQNWGRIIGLATHPVKLSPAYTYNIGKAARMQALLLAQDQAWAHGVTMNVIAPGPVNGIPSLENAIEQSRHDPSWIERNNVSPQDIAEGVAFLCSEAGQYINGCVLPYLFR